MSKLFCIASYVGILTSFIFIFVLVYWEVYPYEIITFGKDNGKILTPVVRAGDYLEMQQDYCKTQDIVSQIDRQFVNSIIYQIPQSLNRRPLGCRKQVEQVYIPKAIPPGMYYISTNITFKVNPIRSITVNVKTARFEITK